MSGRGGRIIKKRGGRGGGGNGGAGRQNTNRNRFNVFINKSNTNNHVDDSYQRICISNLPSTTDRNDLMDFLKNKAYKPNLSFKGSEYKNSRFYFSVERPEDIPSLVQLSGVRYGGAKIIIAKEDKSSFSQNRVVVNTGRGKKDRVAPPPQPVAALNKQMKMLEDHIDANYAKSTTPELVDFSYIHTTKDINFNDLKTIRQLFRLVSEKCKKVYSTTSTLSTISISTTSTSTNLTINYITSSMITVT